jgi:RNA polymerase sigma factor (TIGR02999 family)
MSSCDSDGLYPSRSRPRPSLIHSAPVDDQTPAAQPEDLATMVRRADAGDAEAKDALFTTLYNELHSLAETHLRRSGNPFTMGTTTLLHEAYLNLNSRERVVFPDRLRFLKYASRAMRGLIIDYVREKRAEKRGGDIRFVEMLENAIQAPATDTSLERLRRALDELGQLDPELAELVDLKFFCGFSFAEIAALRAVSERTVQRDWAKARVLLHDALQ